MAPTTTAEEFLARLDDGDATLWPSGNVSATRLGWVTIAREMEREAKELTRWAAGIDQETVVLIGMGGSSLGPLVLSTFAEVFGSPKGRKIAVLDTTDPSSVAATPIEDAFVVVSSKSGTTLEPNVLFAHARSRLTDPKRYAFVTDPGSPLVKLGEQLGVQRIFQNDPNIGGRYSVLSYFGVVAAALAGYDLEELCGRANELDRLEAVEFGLEMGHAAMSGQDKATIRTNEEQRSFGLWVEQLIAESTGKLGRGVVPVPTCDEEHGADRHNIDVHFGAAHELGAQFLRFELATAAVGHVLEIDPFDEPNVAESKANTNRVLSELPLPKIDASEPGDLQPFLDDQVREGDYISIQAYLPENSDEALEALRRQVRDRNGGMAVTAGYGPRFLHSTGQLHKGGPNSVIAVQIIARSPRPVLEIPGEPYDFATLIAAQSIGDNESLKAHDRRVIRIAVDDLTELLT